MSKRGKILVTGATGNFGSVVVQNLLAMGVNLRALEHNTPVSQELKDAGVEVVAGDMFKPETVDAALDGVEQVFLYTPLAPGADEMASNVITAAKRAGNINIVRLSEAPPEPVSKLRIGMMHVTTNEELEASGLPYTSLRPTYFMQNTMFAAESIASDGMIYMPFKDGKLGMVDFRDVAEVAAKVLTSEGHENQIYVLTGPASISFTEVAGELSKALDKQVTYVSVPLEAAREAMLGMGMPEWGADAFCEYYENHSNGGNDFTTNEVETLTGHPARSYETFARDFGPYFVGS
jgi:uncharacterized protein YbjT (DUF2867 family)